MAESGRPGETARLFFAVPVPARLAARIEECLPSLDGDTWTLERSGPEDLHLTLHYLGDTPLTLVDDLKKEVGALCHARRAFDLKAGGLGCFPDESRPRVLWAGIEDRAGALRELFTVTRRVLNAYRLFQLREDFSPHLTLARVVWLSEAWDPRRLRALDEQWKSLGPFPVEELRLMRRLPAPGASVYGTLANLRLG